MPCAGSRDRRVWTAISTPGQPPPRIRRTYISSRAATYLVQRRDENSSRQPADPVKLTGHEGVRSDRALRLRDFPRRQPGLAVELIGLHEQAHEQAGAGQSPQQQAQPRRALLGPILALESKSRDAGRGAQARCRPSTSAPEPAGRTPPMAPCRTRRPAPVRPWPRPAPPRLRMGCKDVVSVMTTHLSGLYCSSRTSRPLSGSVGDERTNRPGRRAPSQATSLLFGRSTTASLRRSVSNEKKPKLRDRRSNGLRPARADHRPSVASAHWFGCGLIGGLR